jgi:lysophospholipase L1-like esterase
MALTEFSNAFSNTPLPMVPSTKPSTHPLRSLTPVERYPFPGFWTPDLEAKRQAVNHWIRASRAYDAVIDFDKLLRDPSHPSCLLPAYDSGDHLHPNDGGYGTMTDAIDLSLFRDDDED